MQRQVSVDKAKLQCNIEMCTYCYIILNVLGKKMRRWKEKSHTCSFHIPIWNEKNYEVISINDIIVIFLKSQRVEEEEGADREDVKIQR